MIYCIMRWDWYKTTSKLLIPKIKKRGDSIEMQKKK